MRTYITTAFCISVALSLSACSAGSRIANIGNPPKMTKIENPVTEPDYQPVSLPMPTPKNIRREHNSLWESDRVTFFKDQRAKNIGDIITVTIDMQDQAEMENQTQRLRQSNEDANLSRLGGLEQSFDAVLPEAINDAASGLLNPSLAQFDSNSNNIGRGITEREEAIDVRLAAIVTQILPNGNMVISGSQEVRVNFEKRVLKLDGVIRPEDIDSQNTIPHDRIAEARIIYGGEGHLTDVQQSRYGHQLYDIIFPF